MLLRSSTTRRSGQRGAHAVSVCIGLALVLCAQVGHGDGFPTRPIRLVVPYPAGGAADVITRMIAKEVEPKLGQSIIVDNRSGGSGFIANQLVASATPDGYSILVGTPAIAANPAFHKKLPYDVLKDYAPITNIASGIGYLIVVTPSFPAKSLQDLIAVARQRPLTYGSAGMGTTIQLATELFNQRAGVRLVHVPYRGVPPALVALMSGEIHVMFVQPPAGVEQIKAGKFRALAFTGVKRWSAMPEVPTADEAGLPGYVVSFTWSGWLAPAKTPRAVTWRIYETVLEVLELPRVQTFLEASGFAPVGSNPDEFRVFIAEEVKRYAEIAARANIKPE